MFNQFIEYENNLKNKNESIFKRSKVILLDKLDG